MIMGYSIYHIHTYPIPDNKAFDVENVGNFLGIGIISYECIGVAYPIRNSMAKPEKFVGLFAVCTLFVASLYTIFPILTIMGKN